MDELKKLNNTADTTNQFNKDDIEKNKLMAILAYIGPLVLLPIFLAKDSRFARYHSNQGLILFVLELVLGFLFGILSFIPLMGIVASLVGLVFLLISILGIVNVVNGRAKELPIIGVVRILD